MELLDKIYLHSSGIPFSYMKRSSDFGDYYTPAPPEGSILFYLCPSFHPSQYISDVHGISISSASRIISDVCNAACMNMNNIVFPSTNEELRKVRNPSYI
jgi:hypothetical protein